MKPGSPDLTHLELNLGLPPSRVKARRAGPKPKIDPPRQHVARSRNLAKDVKNFAEFGLATRWTTTRSTSNDGKPLAVATAVNEFWTARQRQASSLHEVSYRACFKPQLPRFFIERLTSPGDRVYDPFMGRGTTPVEAALLGRIPVGCDINPLSLIFASPRLRPPTLDQVEQRLTKINLSDTGDLWEELLVFYHPDTLREISAVRKYLLARQAARTRDALDDWIALVAMNRLTGHSAGFFSVYSLPPNQAVSLQSQRKINERRNQVPPRRDVTKLILKKSRQLLKDCTPDVRKTLASVADRAQFVNAAASRTPQIKSSSIDLVVTSPPFLDVVQYATDNWLRSWFLGIDPKSVQMTVPKKIEAWREAMTAVFHELARVLKSGGHVAFEVGEIHGGDTKLEEHVLPCGIEAGLKPLLVVINDQVFTKTANCWGIDNNNLGTNSNRIVVFQKP